MYGGNILEKHSITTESVLQTDKLLTAINRRSEKIIAKILISKICSKFLANIHSASTAQATRICLSKTRNKIWITNTNHTKIHSNRKCWTWNHFSKVNSREIFQFAYSDNLHSTKFSSNSRSLIFLHPQRQPQHLHQHTYRLYTKFHKVTDISIQNHQFHSIFSWSSMLRVIISKIDCLRLSNQLKVIYIKLKWTFFQMKTNREKKPIELFLQFNKLVFYW